MVLLDLTAVLDDGRNLGPGVPADDRVAIQLVLGASSTLRVSVVSRSGAPVDLAGKTAVLTVKKQPDDTVPALSVDGDPVPSRGVGQIDFVIASDDWALFTIGRYLYDLWLTDAASPPDAVPLIAAAPLTVLPRVLT